MLFSFFPDDLIIYWKLIVERTAQIQRALTMNYKLLNKYSV
jgi:hypothetical protein